VGALEVSKEVSNIIHVESLHSEKAKAIASEISSDAGRRILKELYKTPLSITDLSRKLDLPISTVQYHVNKLIDLGIVRVAQKRFGKRMREVKMYVYEKESIVFLSSMEKREFEFLLKIFLTQKLKGSLPKIAALIAMVGLIFSSAEFLLLKWEMENFIGFPGEITSDVIRSVGLHLFFTIFGVTLLLGVIILLVVIYFIKK
jgi:DNA-binding transcriptional ArsR family regulator